MTRTSKMNGMRSNIVLADFDSQTTEERLKDAGLHDKAASAITKEFTKIVRNDMRAMKCEIIDNIKVGNKNVKLEIKVMMGKMFGATIGLLAAIIAIGSGIITILHRGL